MMDPRPCRATPHRGWWAWIPALLLGLLATAPGRGTEGMPGELIDVGGFRVHIDCDGRGEPAVIFDVGLGGTSLEWSAVRRVVRTFARACVYDRAGYGWSDPGPRPRTSARIAAELAALLDGAGLQRPVILVGHSYGGYNMQLFARRYPHRVAGLVLVDAAHPDQVERFRAPPIGINTAPSHDWGVVQFGAPPAPHPRLAADIANRRARPRQIRRTLADELLHFRQSARELREAPALTRLPLVVISRGRRERVLDRRGELIEQTWLDLQSELAAQSPTALHIVALGSGHQVHLDQPGIVAYAIALITDRCRATPGGTGVALRPSAVARARVAFSDAVWYRYAAGFGERGCVPVSARTWAHVSGAP